MKELIIPVEGENADEIIEEFWAWFLDGGGEQMFFDSVEMDNNFSVMSQYDDKEGKWFLKQVEKDEY